MWSSTKSRPDHREFTSKVESSWEDLIKEDVKLSWTPKIHHIIHHFSDYFEDSLVGKRSLFDTTDQIIKHCHSYVNRLLTTSFYKLKNADSKNGPKKQHAGILKINAYAVKIKNV